MVLSQAKTFVRPKKTSYFIYFSLIGIKMCGFTCFTTELDRSGFFLQGKGKGRGSGAYKTKKNKQTNWQTHTQKKGHDRIIAWKLKEEFQANKGQIKHGLKFSIRLSMLQGLHCQQHLTTITLLTCLTASLSFCTSIFFASLSKNSSSYLRMSTRLLHSSTKTMSGCTAWIVCNKQKHRSFLKIQA